MRIVHLIVGLGDGGAERSLYKLITADDNNVHSVISFTSRGKYGRLLSEEGVSVVAIESSPWKVIPNIISLLRSLRVMKPEILHGWMPHGSLVASLVKNLTGARKLLWSIRASDYGDGIRTSVTRGIVRILARLSHHWPDKILVVGQRALETHVKFGFNRDKMICIPNGYEPAGGQILNQGKKKTSTSDKGPRTNVLGMVARYHPQKDHLGLLRALSLLKSKRADWILWLAGEGLSENNDELVAELSRLGLSAHVELLGAAQNPEELFRTLDFHILSSAFGEGFPNVVAESMLAGVPNIVTDVGDSANIVGDTGWVVRPSAPEDLADAIEAALNCEPSERHARGVRAKARILQSYSMKAMVDNHIREYERRRLIAYPRYSQLGASSRVRMYQFEERLRNSRWEVSFYPFATDSFLQSRYRGKRDWAGVAASYWRRILSLREMKTAELVWVEKEFIPWVPSWIEKAFVSYRSKIVYDFDDAVHEQFRDNPHALVRGVLGNKIPNTVAKTSLVVAGNSTLQEYFSTELGVTSLLVPSTIDTKRLSLAEGTLIDETRPFVFGWIGTPVTYETYVEPLLSMFELEADRLAAEFWVIGVPEPSEHSQRVKFFPWSLENEALTLQGIDVGIMPLKDDPWSRGKCGYKLLQYMAVGKAVVASPVGANKEIVSHGVTGYLVPDDSSWPHYLSLLAGDRNLCAAMGKRGSERVVSSYSSENAGRGLADYFDQIVGN